MDEEMSDLIKYKSVVLELKKLLGKKYFVSSSEYRWIDIYKKSILGDKKVASIYPIDKDGYGTIKVSNSELYGFFKRYGELKGYPTIERDFKIDGDEVYYVEPEYIEIGKGIKDDEKILRLRFAKGEISIEEYTERMARL